MAWGIISFAKAHSNMGVTEAGGCLLNAGSMQLTTASS